MKKQKKDNFIYKFFNSPKPIIISLIIICVILIIFIANYSSKDKIYVGKLSTDDVAISDIHYFTNGDMNYFYASQAIYGGKDVKIEEIIVGYYMVDQNNKYYPFAIQKKELDKKRSIKEAIESLSNWSFPEPASSKGHFTDDVIKNLDNIHFVIKAKTKKDLKDYDINIDYPINVTKITK